MRLASRNLTASDVVNALLEQNVEIPAGQLGQPPAKTTQAFQIPVRVVGRLSDPAQFDNIILKSSPNGLVQLKDVGHSVVAVADFIDGPNPMTNADRFVAKTRDFGQYR